ncbi:hypothetical protein PUNSTDRAFT_136965 [Punctularia strigosozonata HHB-11173 SS5]|uniref:uncharacterized protein n=1 Tax=Punctularia strigosozonata (strain HHB-11173) TaxID=741275 RepID=UPI0004417420|nr:uncharacterized protein PUNSTDRAFT_136965 [Punctularia strigosozonata HHB-11173 SS5]EIN06175.1 hypothetical protein PUNSTDRAFT_136965 [Punctularia strigosozonata HHB-11173 SS5]
MEIREERPTDERDQNIQTTNEQRRRLIPHAHASTMQRSEESGSSGTRDKQPQELGFGIVPRQNPCTRAIEAAMDGAMSDRKARRGIGRQQKTKGLIEVEELL